MTQIGTDMADTRLLQAVHKTFRLATTRLVDATAKLEPAALQPALGPYWAFYSAILQYHHHTEDTEDFPALVKLYPDIKPRIDELGRDHEKMVTVMDRVDAAVKEFELSPDLASRDRVHASAVELRDLFFPHLDVEDAEVIPMFAKYIPADEWARMDAKALRNIPKPQLGRAVGALDEVIRSLPAADQPLPPPRPVRVMLTLAWRKKWAALVQPLLV